MQIKHVEIDAAYAGQRVDNFLLRELGNVPRSRVYRILRKGEVRINGGRAKPTRRLAVGDVVRMPVEELESKKDLPAPPKRLIAQLESRILYENKDLLAINKPSGLAVHGGSGLSFGAIECMRQMRPGQSLELAHRLDRDTSGCLLIAKNRSTLLRLHDYFRKRQMKKTYQVLVYGAWKKADRSVRLNLKKYVVASGERRVRVDLEGKSARTEFTILHQTDAATWLQAQPHSGRTHQIRVHTLACGAPIVGDDKYASDKQLAESQKRGIRRLCLHASKLVLPALPEGEGRDGDAGKYLNQSLKIEAPTPKSFLQAWTHLH